MTLGFHQFHRLLVEGDEDVPAEPVPFIGGNAVGEVAARFKKRQPNLHGLPIHHNVGGINKAPDRVGDVHRGNLVPRDRTQTSSQRAGTAKDITSALASSAWAILL